MMKEKRKHEEEHKRRKKQMKNEGEKGISIK
jgi:hypothetical protein